MLTLLSVVTGALLVGFLLSAPVNAQSSDSIFTVDSTADDADAGANGVCATAAGACTLRAAIEEANLHSGADTIAFNIPGDGVQTIQLTGALPMLEDRRGPTMIDGYTQPDSSPNTDALASDAVIKVEIKGNGHDSPESGGFNGLIITSPGNTVRGLAFYSLFRPISLYGSNAHNNGVSGNFLGTDAAGTYSAPQQVPHSYGIFVSSGATSNTIGGASAAERNVISGNAFHGVALSKAGTDSNVVAGNLIGLDPTGSKRLSNGAHGIDLNAGASENVIGGDSPEERNVISGNASTGIEVSHYETDDPSNPVPTGNQMIGNFIGTDITGEFAPEYSYNGGRGVFLEDGARSTVIRENVVGNNRDNGILIVNSNTVDNQVYNNRIGVSRGGEDIPNGSDSGDAGVAIERGADGSQIGPDNIVANNPVGIRLSGTGSDSNTITRNSIYGNNGLGIDLDPLGTANKNDLGDADTGANELQNFPVISSAKTSKNGTRIAGKLNSIPNKDFTVQFFANPEVDSSGNGEGKTFIGEKVVTTGADANATFTFKPAQKVAKGQFITATATDSDGNTSEFSVAKKVVRKR